jgi:hypothetical protein
MQTDWICKRLAGKACSEILHNGSRNILCLRYGFKDVLKEGKQNSTTVIRKTLLIRNCTCYNVDPMSSTTSILAENIIMLAFTMTTMNLSGVVSGPTWVSAIENNHTKLI